MAQKLLVHGFGAWYDTKQGDEGDLWHRTLIDPGLFAKIGEVSPGCRVLDIGCGNGYVARRLARRGARVVGVDLSRALIARAAAREEADPLGIRYHVADAARLRQIPTASVDLALANMSLMDIEDAAGAIREVSRVVVDGGRFVFSISHPCFDIDTRSTYVAEPSSGGKRAPTIFRKVTGYRRPHSDRFEWYLPDGRTAVTVGHHRPLGWYAHELRRGGWVILDMVEPSPGVGFVGRRIQREWIEEIPLHLVVEARREPRRRRSARTHRGP